MAKILRLPGHVADLIAAGEVVERPASVIKELMENSIDAHSRAVTVEIRGGGLTYMRVTDNGCGMPPEDAETAFLRHATSKLADERGLEAISTLGFRGEALAAISSVSRITLTTREKGAPEGARVVLEGGHVVSSAPFGCPEGTDITVSDLFYNTPARLKFMKNDRAEGMACLSAAARCALSHPEVSVRFIKDGETEFHTPGDGRIDSAVYSVLGRGFSAGLLEVSGAGAIAVSGYVSAPNAARGNRTGQYFFLNGRHIKSKTLQAALEQAYRNCLFTGKFPACVIYITMPPSAVDVNVHPAKTEVRFLREREVFDAVHYAVRGALERETKSAEIELSPATKKALGEAPVRDVKTAEPVSPPAEKPKSYVPPKTSGGFRTMDAASFRSSFSSGGFKTAVPPTAEKKPAANVHDETRAVYQTRFTMPGETSEPTGSYVSAKGIELGRPAEPEKPPYRIVGEALGTYIIVEREDSLFLIDKHAAHERMIFDRLRTERPEVMSQTLLVPSVVTVGAEDFAVIFENLEKLEELGFEIDEFGAGAVVVRRTPADVDAGEIASMLGEICASLRSSGGAESVTGRDAVLASVACKAAIKAGRRSEPEELRAVAEAVMSGRVKYCPHGRPVMTELTKTSLDRSFKRI